MDDWKQIIKKMFRLGFKVIMYSFLYFTFHYVYNLDSRQQLLKFGFKTAKSWNMYVMAERNDKDIFLVEALRMEKCTIQTSFIHILNLFTLPLI